MVQHYKNQPPQQSPMHLLLRDGPENLQSSATVAEAEPDAVDMEDIAGEFSVTEDADAFIRDSSGPPFHLRTSSSAATQDHEAAVIDRTWQ
jgi:hypothetical protein